MTGEQPMAETSGHQQQDSPECIEGQEPSGHSEECGGTRASEETETYHRHDDSEGTNRYKGRSDTDQSHLTQPQTDPPATSIKQAQKKPDDKASAHPTRFPKVHPKGKPRATTLSRSKLKGIGKVPHGKRQLSLNVFDSLDVIYDENETLSYTVGDYVFILQEQGLPEEHVGQILRFFQLKTTWWVQVKQFYRPWELPQFQGLHPWDIIRSNETWCVPMMSVNGKATLAQREVGASKGCLISRYTLAADHTHLIQSA